MIYDPPCDASHICTFGGRNILTHIMLQAAANCVNIINGVFLATFECLWALLYNVYKLMLSGGVFGFIAIWVSLELLRNEND